MRKTLTSIILIVIGIGFSIWGWQAISRSFASLGWPVAKGTVIYSKVRSYHSLSNGRSSVMYSADIRYKYRVKGKGYVSEKVSRGDYSSNSYSTMRKIVQKYPLGKEVTVYYNPAEPKESYLEPGPAVITYLPFAFGLLGIFSGCVALVRSRKSKEL